MMFALMGLLLLSALLYYRAVKIQRYAEPALALLQPRMEFGRKINRLFADHLKERDISGIRFTTDAIYIDESLLLAHAQINQAMLLPIIHELGKSFRAVLDNPELRSYIDFILISSVRTIAPGEKLAGRERRLLQHNSDFVLKSLYMVEPNLELQYGSYFATTVMTPVNAGSKQKMIEFRFIPSERLHIDFLTKLIQLAD
jgi:hypothetical protein